MEVERHYFTTAGKKFRRAKCGENLSKLVPGRNARFSYSIGKEKSTERTSQFIGSIFRLSRYHFEKSRLKIVLKLHGIEIIVKSL